MQIEDQGMLEPGEIRVVWIMIKPGASPTPTAKRNAPGALQPLELRLQKAVPIVARRPRDRPAKDEERQRSPQVLGAAALPRGEQVPQRRDDGGGERLGRDGPPHEGVVVERQQVLQVALFQGEGVIRLVAKRVGCRHVFGWRCVCGDRVDPCQRTTDTPNGHNP